MSTEHINSAHAGGEAPFNKDVSYESRDLKPKVILWSLFFLALTVLVSLVICKFVLNYTTHLATEGDTHHPPIWQELTPQQRAAILNPPEPVLQGVPIHPSDAQQDLRNKIKADTEANERLGWIDQKDGIAQIPVEGAMKMIAQKGLPAVPPPAAAKKK
jgi:hypothetical protein